MELVPADRFGAAHLAALFTAAYQEYFVPIRVDEPAFRFMAEAWDYDLARSRVALEDGEPVGLCMLGVRGGRGWIGGVAVVPPRRRHGIGRALMEAVLAEAPREVWLEVIEANRGAIALYERLGFRLERMLGVWSLASEPPASSAAATTAEDAAALVAELRASREPWQRERVPSDANGLRMGDDGAVLFRLRDTRVDVAQLAARDERAAAALLAGARARGDSLRFGNVPEGDAASAALLELGASLDVRQLELVRR